MIYLRAGLFAEGPTDYDFFLELIDSLVVEIAAEVLGGGFEIARPVGIDAPAQARRSRREERIAAAIDASWEECTVFVIHSDGAGDHEAARCNLVDPGIVRARLRHPDLVGLACIPIRETEAWMLADGGAFCRIFNIDRAPDLPSDPESEMDPKRVLRAILASLGARPDRGIRKYYVELGREVRPAELRRLPAFRRFEADLRLAIASLAPPASAAT
jgi:hypothetical protein